MARSRADELRRGGTAVEWRLNASGYDLMRAGASEDAVAVFRLITQLFPDAWNGWDSLASGLASLGHRQEAIAAYRRSLSLNGYNENARRELRLLALAGQEGR